jgi:hypothetical protein
VTSDPTAEKRKDQAKALIAAMNHQMKDEFERSKEILLNANTKGAEYEKEISRMLGTYLGSRFEFHTRAQLIDVNMEYLNLFSVGENEVDVAATFIQTYPKIVLKIGDTKYIPYDGAAFIIEVKKTIDKSKFEKDLRKLEKISKLNLSADRLGGVTQGGQHSIDRPLRLLFYFESSIDETIRQDLMLRYCHAWDMILIIQKNELLSNRRLPAVNALMSARSWHGQMFSWGGDNCFIMLLFFLSLSIPVPIGGVNVIKTFLNLDMYSKT